MLLLVIGFAGLCRAAGGGDAWPGPGLVIAKETISPNGKYAIVVPTAEAAGDEESSVNQFADVITHRLLGKIAGTFHWVGQNHRFLNAWWAPDSSWCVAAYFNRLGFDECVVLEPRGDSFGATEIGKQIHDALEAAIQKQSRHPGEDRGASLYLRPAPNRTLLVRAIGTTNPKGMEGEKSYDAFLSGSYDVATNKWTKLNTRPLDSKTNIRGAFATIEGELVRIMPPNTPWPAGFNGEVVITEEQRAKTLDQLLNNTYAAVRFVTPPDRFATIKQEQRAWLASWVQAKSLPEKNAMTNARIHQLRAILWEE